MPRGPTPRALAVGRGPWAVGRGRRRLAPGAAARARPLSAAPQHRGAPPHPAPWGLDGASESALASVAGNMCLPCVSVCLCLFMCGIG